jgi:hypothetical protein
MAAKPFHGSSSEETALFQDCQMEYFQTKNTNLGKFWRVLRAILNFTLAPRGELHP